MLDELINSITRDSELPADLFVQMLETEDIVDRTNYIEKCRTKCRQCNRVREFDSRLSSWIQKKAQLTKQDNSNKTAFTDAPIVLNCGKYKADDGGVVLNDITNKGDPYTVMACPHAILPVERMVNIDTDTEKLKIAFFKDQRWQNVTVDCQTVFNKSHISSLSDRGILVTSESAKELVKYIAEVVSLNMEIIPLYRSISRCGWIDEDFAPYVKDIKYDGDIDFESIYKCVCEKGDYGTWLEHIYELRENINMRLMIATSFASPLIEIVGALPFVLHLWGTTGFGKTVSLMVAMSVWGNPEMGKLVRSMNITANAMARTSAFLYSIPFAADELQQIKSRWDNYDNLIMYLTEGVDRGRAKNYGGIEKLKTWRNAFMFTGEEPVTKSASGGGVKNRVIELEVETPLIKNGNETVNIITENYGFAGSLFIKYLQIIDREQIKARYKDLFTEIINTVDTTEKQAMSAALIILADELSCESIFGGEPLTIHHIKSHLASTKSVDVSERAYDWVLNWISRNAIRFNDDTDENRGEIWGRFEQDTALINKDVLTEAMKQVGYDYTAVIKKWDKAGRIIRNTQGRLIHQTKVQNIKASYIKVNLVEETESKEIVKDVAPMQKQESMF